MKLLDRSDRTKFKKQFLNPLLDEELIEMTIPDKPTSSKQKYRLTEKGLAVLQNIEKEMQ
jgi:predicted transcriptional regulator